VRDTFEGWIEKVNAEGADEGAAGAKMGIDFGSFKHLVFLCVHSHNKFTGVAAIPEVRSSLSLRQAPCCLVFVPCCHRFCPTKDVGRKADVVYEDLAVFSACRQISVWNWDPIAE
jgi:hypothetical protein